MVWINLDGLRLADLKYHCSLYIPKWNSISHTIFFLTSPLLGYSQLKPSKFWVVVCLFHSLPLYSGTTIQRWWIMIQVCESKLLRAIWALSKKREGLIFSLPLISWEVRFVSFNRIHCTFEDDLDCENGMWEILNCPPSVPQVQSNSLPLGTTLK